MIIPKIIWALWCDFDKKADGNLNYELTYFKDRIIQQHVEWEINIITTWETLIEYIKDNSVLISLLDNPYVGGAHKSDAIRFFLLNKFGGFWIDISTFLFTSLDIYYTKQRNATFICYYTPPFMVEEIMFNSLGDMFDSVKYNEVVNKFKSIQPEYIKLNDKYKNYPFIPENFFIACTANHPIIYSTFQQLTNFWESSLQKITNHETLCYEINILMNTLALSVFDINTIEKKLMETFSDSDITNKQFFTKLLDNMWHCGYIFNYLEIYKAIVEYIEGNTVTLSQEDNNVIDNPYKSDLCSIDNNIDACKNIIVTNDNNGDVLYLLSLSYNRLIKWANTMDERLSFENTYIDNLTRNIKDENEKKEVIEKIVEDGIYQIKFSSWTRRSGIIARFMKLYPNKSLGGGNKTQISNKKKRHSSCRRHSHRRHSRRRHSRKRYSYRKYKNNKL